MATAAQNEKARLAAIAAIRKDLPQLANPEKYVTTANKADLAGARKEYLQTNLGLDSALFKSGGSYDIKKANSAYAIKSLGLDYTKFAKSGYNIAVANEAAKFKQLGVQGVESLIQKDGKFDIGKAEETLIRDVYKDNPANYVTKAGQRETGRLVTDRVTGASVPEKMDVYKYDIGKAGARAEAARPKIESTTQYPQNFTQAVNNYNKAFESATTIGLENINEADRKTLQKIGRTVRDFSGKNISENQKNIIDRITDVDTVINNYDAQRRITAEQARGIPGTPEYNALTAPERKAADASWRLNKDKNAAYSKLRVDRESITRLATDAKNLAPAFQESFTRYGLSDVVQGIGADKRPGQLSAALEQLSTGQAVTGTGQLAAKLNSEVSDDQVLADINTGAQKKYKELFDIGTAAGVDLQSQITQANQFLTDLSPTDPRRKATQDSIDSLTKELGEVQADTLQAKSLLDNYKPVTGADAATKITQFRDALKLPEERTLKQIEQIDPTIGATVRGLTKQYQTMAETPLGATTTAQTEDLRNTIEQEAINQLKLGSTIGAEERRGYEQAARAAQTARGNIFGLGPAVQEAASIGAAGEQRKMARYGAAAAFLGSGETTGAATARDLGLRNALEQSRLGAAQGFIASGPTMYNLASQRLGTQQGLLNNYLAASTPQATGGFQATPSAANPYAYVNPNAGFIGAQNAASIYNTLADYASQTYGAQVGAISRQPSGAEQFGQIATGLSNLIKI